MKEPRHTDHLANQRTFLAWIRTNLGIMAFGFLIERFSYLTQPSPYSFFLGTSLILLGTLLTILAFIKYKKTEKQINRGSYQSSLFFDFLLSLFITLFGFSLLLFLFFSFL